MAMGEDGSLCKLFGDDDCEFRHVSGDLFSILDTWEKCMNGTGDGGGGAPGSAAALSPSSVVVIDGAAENNAVGAPRPKPGSRRHEAADEEKGGADPVRKKHKGSTVAMAPAVVDDVSSDGAAKMSSHITVERNRRKQMNENLAVLRTLMPCFYVKRGDQASVIGGVVDYIKELQQVLHSLEAKKHRKVYAEAHAPSPRASPRPAPLSPRPLLKPPISPRPAVPISPPTPTPGSPYKPIQRLPHYISPAMTPTTSSSSTSHAPSYDIISPRPYLPTLDSIVTELAAQAAARAPSLLGGGGGGGPGLNLLGLLLPDVKVEFTGPNLVLKTMSHRARSGQVLRIIAALESLSLEILHVSISTVDDTMVHSFTIKIGIECELSAEELVQEIRQTFL